jgi:hypothetical protein
MGGIMSKEKKDIKPQVEALLLSRFNDRDIMRKVLEEPELEKLLNESVVAISQVFESTANHFIRMAYLQCFKDLSDSKN